MSTATPRTVRDLFPSKYLTANDIIRPVKATISRIDFEELRQRDQSRELKAIVHFTGHNKALVLNKTNGFALAEITGTEEIAAWAGTVWLA